jgi:hypothetical protein
MPSSGDVLSVRGQIFYVLSESDCRSNRLRPCLSIPKVPGSIQKVAADFQTIINNDDDDDDDNLKPREEGKRSGHHTSGNLYQRHLCYTAVP